MNKIELHKIIRKHSEAIDCAYRITRDGEVHYYGQMPNSVEIGWYLMAQDAEKFAEEIKVGRR